VFAPAAATVHEAGVDRFHEDAGFVPADSIEDLQFPAATVSETGASGEALVVDGFGNVVTNVLATPSPTGSASRSGSTANPRRSAGRTLTSTRATGSSPSGVTATSNSQSIETGATKASTSTPARA